MTNPLEITIETRSVYGNTLIYPVCPQAHRFAALMGKKTFSQRDIQQIAEMGFAVFVPDTRAFLRAA